MKKNDLYPTLTTPRYDEIDPASSWNEYPRPQMVRDSFFPLNGYWDFAITGSADIPDTYEKSIVVPFPPESKLSGIQTEIKSGDKLHYRRKFKLPDGFIKDRILLHFGAVDQICDVYVNGKFVTHNEGGYIPFFADITNLMDGPEGEICVTVTDENDDTYPYGKQKKKRGGMWYTPVSGIWQTVWIESLPKDHISSIKIDQTAKYAKFTVKSTAENIKLIIKETGDRIEVIDGEAIFRPEAPHLWAPEDPYLYHYEMSCGDDLVNGYFALREIGFTEVSGRARLTLNGEPYFFSGLLDQGYFPDGIFTPPSPASYEDDILAAKALGFNMLRKHIKIEPMIFYHLGDKLGIVVFQDMVNNSAYSFFLDTVLPTIGIKKTLPARHASKKKRAIFEKHMMDTAELLYNCPSVLQYTIFNEGWGQFSSEEMYTKLMQYDPSRIIDATSGWFRGKLSDTDSRHVYFKIPNIRRTDGKPLYLSEFGGYSLRCDGHLFGKKNYGYSLYKNEEDFTAAFVKLYKEGVLPLISSVGLSASVYTQLTDVEDETNGLLTYDRRKFKISKEQARAVNEELYREGRKK